MSKWREKNLHHIIWQCNKSRAKTGDTRNHLIMDKKRHEWLNDLFHTLQSPHQQLEYLRTMYDTVLSDTAKDLFDDLLCLDLKSFYAKWLIR